MSVNKCLFCGSVIPEGRQICPNCEERPQKTKTRKEKKKMSVYIFPAVLILLDVGAAIMCFIGKDYKKGVYWLAAAVLNICVTF